MPQVSNKFRISCAVVLMGQSASVRWEETADITLLEGEDQKHTMEERTKLMVRAKKCAELALAKGEEKEEAKASGKQGGNGKA